MLNSSTTLDLEGFLPSDSTFATGRAKESTSDRQIPLCVDLDGTLLRGNSLLEAVRAEVLQRPAVLLKLPFWLLRGQAYLWRKVSDAPIHFNLLPFRQTVVEQLGEARGEGRAVFLVTGASSSVAQGIADLLGIFDGVLATEGNERLVGDKKCELLTGRFGARGFDYIGDSRSDRKVWESARRAVLVNQPPVVERELEKRGTVVKEVIRDGRGNAPAVIAALRPHHWLKNLLVFLPGILAHNLLAPAVFWKSVLATVAFCFSASAVYLLNDLIDLDADRNHETKRNRPLASGALGIDQAVVLALALLAGTVTICTRLPLPFAGAVCIYLLASLLYSLRLKTAVLVDVFTLAGLYALRVLAGGAATRIPISTWTLAFCIFLFLSLALLKRHAELQTWTDEHKDGPVRRGYRKSDAGLIAALGISSGYVAVLVTALYIQSPAVVRLYSHPQRLWLVCPLLAFWVSRLWLISHRGELHEDPVLFAARERGTRLVLLLVGAAIALAI